MTTAPPTTPSTPLPTTETKLNGHAAGTCCGHKACCGTVSAQGVLTPKKREGAGGLDPLDSFWNRHIGPSEDEIGEMLSTLGLSSLDQLVAQTIPASIRAKRTLSIGEPKCEAELLAELKQIAQQNTVFRSFIGMGYHGTITPGVILRNILENPGWYTQYTPYQAEIAQGRLEALLNFQTMVSDLTGLPLAGASLLDEGTAAAEAMAMCHGIAGGKKNTFLVAKDCHPQTIAVVRTRAETLGIEIAEVDAKSIDWSKQGDSACGILVQYPTTDGRVECYESLTKAAHEAGAKVVVATDLLALALLTPPGEWNGGGGGGANGADIAVGSSQRFGVPMGFGGPHAAFIATRSEYARRLPGRIIGVSRDAQGHPAYRMAIQTREQHIKRERATSNICTAQALLAIIAGMYAVYHGPAGVKAIAQRVNTATRTLRAALAKLGHGVDEQAVVFDTIRVTPKGSGGGAGQILEAARAAKINLRDFGDGSVGISLDETVTRADLANILKAFGGSGTENLDELAAKTGADVAGFARTSAFLTHHIFNTHHSETELLRYIFSLQGRDLSLAHSMIPLGSCTMKLNATSEMVPVTWPEFADIHPFAPAEQTKGYRRLFSDLEKWLADITGFAAVSLQPNAGSQGEYAGLCVIRAYHHAKGNAGRNICLIPESAHGTNPASAVIAGFKVVGVANEENGNINLADLKAKIAEHKDHLGALMVTYPSTYGVFEDDIKEVIKLVHDAGGQVYMDGANMNAQVGLCSPGEIGADVCHLNLHKTFCIPHGGGGPGMGPIGVAAHLAPYLPGHPVVSPFTDGKSGGSASGAVSAAPWGSPLILTIPWVYIALMGSDGLTRATEVAILNANYMAKRLEGHYDVLFRGPAIGGGPGRCAHEFIIDVGHFDDSADVKPEDIAKRLMDYGFHAPTMSWPVAGTLMVEPTESESKAELDRFCDAMIAIREEIRLIEEGKSDKASNPLKHAPHTVHAVSADNWDRPYSREQGAFPKAAPWLRGHKFWPAVGRVDNPYGDRNLVCTCPPMSAYSAG